MNIKKILIDRFATWVLGHDLWGKAQGIVNILKDETISGKEKQAQALDMLENMGLAALGFLLNLAIELAVAKLKFSQ